MTAVKLPRASESQCQATIVDAARRGGWLCHAERTSTTAGGRWMTAIQGDVGWPDLVLVRHHEAVFLELKRRPGRVAPAQQTWLHALRAAGLRAGVVWVPEGVDQLVDFLLARPGDRRPELELDP